MPRDNNLQRSKAWVFTLNNPGTWRIDWDQMGGADGPLEYAVYQLEAGASGTPHLQGYMYFKTRRTLLTVKRLINNRMHLEVAKGNVAQNKAYCTKAEGRIEGPWEHGGVPATQGRRSDWEDLRHFIQEQLEAGMEEDLLHEELLLRDPAKWAKEHKAILRLIEGVKKLIRRAAFAEHPDSVVLPPKEVHLYWGETGAGKTRRAWMEAGPLAYTKPKGPWFDGYSGEANVILDEWPDMSLDINMVLGMLDRYTLNVPVKGGFVSWQPKRIWITSNIPPSEWYPEASEQHRAALRRRIQEFGTKEHMTSPASGAGTGSASETAEDQPAGAGWMERDPDAGYCAQDGGYEMF